jgi:hypothetical protein
MSLVFGQILWNDLSYKDEMGGAHGRDEKYIQN